MNTGFMYFSYVYLRLTVQGSVNVSTTPIRDRERSSPNTGHLCELIQTEMCKIT